MECEPHAIALMDNRVTIKEYRLINCLILDGRGAIVADSSFMIGQLLIGLKKALTGIGQLLLTEAVTVLDD